MRGVHMRTPFLSAGVQARLSSLGPSPTDSPDLGHAMYCWKCWSWEIGNRYGTVACKPLEPEARDVGSPARGVPHKGTGCNAFLLCWLLEYAGMFLRAAGNSPVSADGSSQIIQLREAFQKHFLLKSVPEVECKAGRAHRQTEQKSLACTAFFCCVDGLQALSLSMKVKHAVPQEASVLDQRCSWFNHGVLLV